MAGLWTWSLLPPARLPSWVSSPPFFPRRPLPGGLREGPGVGLLRNRVSHRRPAPALPSPRTSLTWPQVWPAERGALGPVPLAPYAGVNKGQLVPSIDKWQALPAAWLPGSTAQSVLFLLYTGKLHQHSLVGSRGWQRLFWFLFVLKIIKGCILSWAPYTSAFLSLWRFSFQFSSGSYHNFWVDFFTQLFRLLPLKVSVSYAAKASEYLLFPLTVLCWRLSPQVQKNCTPRSHGEERCGWNRKWRCFPWAKETAHLQIPSPLYKSKFCY